MVAPVEVISEAEIRRDDLPLWLERKELADGEALRWSGEQGDEAVYVVRGLLRTADGRECPPDGAVVVDAGAEGSVVAVGATEVVQFGSTEVRVPDAGAGEPTVTVVGEGGTFYEGDGDYRRTRFFADSSSPTNPSWLLCTERFGFYETSAHSHSQDELIHVLRGEIHVGRRVIEPGASLWVEGDRRYKFRTGDEGVSFLNWRRGPSTMTRERGSEPIVETGAANSMQFVNDVR